MGGVARFVREALGSSGSAEENAVINALRDVGSIDELRSLLETGDGVSFVIGEVTGASSMDDYAARVCVLTIKGALKRLQQRPYYDCLRHFKFERKEEGRNRKVARSSTGPGKARDLLPSNVVEWSDFPVPTSADSLEESVAVLKNPHVSILSEQFLKRNPLSMHSNEATMMGSWTAYLFAPILSDVSSMIRNANPSAPRVLFARQEKNGAGTIPDVTVYAGSLGATEDSGVDDNVIFVVEGKRPGANLSANIVVQYSDMDTAALCAIGQVYEYLCVAAIRYAILTTGRYTWFFKRDEEEVVFISNAFEVDSDAPTLAQALAYFIALVLRGDFKLQGMVDATAVSSLRAAQKSHRAFLKRQADQNAQDDSTTQGSAGEHAGGKGAGDLGNSAALSGDTAACSERPKSTLELPLDDDDVEFSMSDRTEDYGELNFGLAFRVCIQGIDSVVKMVDAEKEKRGAEILRAEADSYLALKSLWGVAIPGLVFATDLNMGRYGLATTYAGKTLETAEDVPPNFREQTEGAVGALHLAGYVHDDLALRNIAVSSSGKVLLIDLGMARKARDNTDFRNENLNLLELMNAFESRVGTPGPSPTSTLPASERQL